MDGTITYLFLIPIVYVFVVLLVPELKPGLRTAAWLTAILLAAANPTSVYMFLILLLITASNLIQYFHSRNKLKSKHWSCFYL